MRCKTIAIIPARGGSKRIPKKNIKQFLGIPMIERTIQTLLNGNLFERIIVSTDDEEIAQVAKNAGAEVPFLRDAGLADDHTPTAPVIREVIDKYYQKFGLEFDFCCCVYPCNPLLDNTLLERARSWLAEREVDFVFPVCKYPHPIQRSLYKAANGKMSFRYPEFELTRTQDLEDLYHDAGQFYFGKVSAWLAGRKMHTDGVGIVVPMHKVIDIDTLEDWKQAELLFKTIETGKVE